MATICDFDCFSCKFNDCINDEMTTKDFEQSKKLERIAKVENGEKKKQTCDERKEANRNWARKNYQANKEKVKLYLKKYRETHKEKIKLYAKKYYETHKEEIKAYQKEYQKKLREKRKQEG